MLLLWEQRSLCLPPAESLPARLVPVEVALQGSGLVAQLSTINIVHFPFLSMTAEEMT